MKHEITRRSFVKAAAATLVAPASCLQLANQPARAARLSRDDDELLDEICRRSFRFFWEQAPAKTGLVKDRAAIAGEDFRRESSIAAVGFGLTALCIAHERGYHDRSAIQQRVRTTLAFLKNKLPHEHGFFFHFVDFESGKRAWKCELSSIDTALLLAGVLTARQHFREPEIRDLATEIYHRADWRWMMNGGSTLTMGWKPESGFLSARWDTYCELMILYLLAIGSPTHPIPSEAWHAFKRPWVEYRGIRYISTDAPLFIHQFSHAWVDYREKHDKYADYFANSIYATRAHKVFCTDIAKTFRTYRENLWGITASDSRVGYQAWGGPPPLGKLDGSVVPCAAAGSLPFLPEDCLKVLRTIRKQYPLAWNRYGFADAFHPLDRWYNPDVIGIDVGATLLAAENLRTGYVWDVFMTNPEIQVAMKRAGFTSSPA